MSSLNERLIKFSGWCYPGAIICGEEYPTSNFTFGRVKKVGDVYVIFEVLEYNRVNTDVKTCTGSEYVADIEYKINPIPVDTEKIKKFSYKTIRNKDRICDDGSVISLGTCGSRSHIVWKCVLPDQNGVYKRVIHIDKYS